MSDGSYGPTKKMLCKDLSMCRIRIHNNVFRSWLVTYSWTLRCYMTKQFMTLVKFPKSNLGFTCWYEVDMSHIANSDKSARKQVSRSEKSNVMHWQQKKVKKKNQSTLFHPSGTVSHQSGCCFWEQMKSLQSCFRVQWMKGHRVSHFPSTSQTAVLNLKGWEMGNFGKENKETHRDGSLEI